MELTSKEKVLKVYPNAQEAICIWDGEPYKSSSHLGCTWDDAASKLPDGVDCVPVSQIDDYWEAELDRREAMDKVPEPSPAQPPAPPVDETCGQITRESFLAACAEVAEQSPRPMRMLRTHYEAIVQAESSQPVESQPSSEHAQGPAHDLYKTGDADAPDVIRDRNGEVVLAMCRRCGKGEIELKQPCVAEQGEPEADEHNCTYSCMKCDACPECEGCEHVDKTVWPQPSQPSSADLEEHPPERVLMALDRIGWKTGSSEDKDVMRFVQRELLDVWEHHSFRSIPERTEGEGAQGELPKRPEYRFSRHGHAGGRGIAEFWKDLIISYFETVEAELQAVLSREAAMKEDNAQMEKMEGILMREVSKAKKELKAKDARLEELEKALRGQAEGAALQTLRNVELGDELQRVVEMLKQYRTDTHHGGEGRCEIVIRDGGKTCDYRCATCKAADAILTPKETK